MPPSPYPRLPWSCGRGDRESAGASVKASHALNTMDFAKLMKPWAMSHSFLVGAANTEFAVVACCVRVGRTLAAEPRLGRRIKEESRS